MLGRHIYLSMAVVACLLFACTDASGETTQVGGPAATRDKDRPATVATSAQTVAASDLPRMIEIPGAERLGFSRASAYEITWREYARSVRNGGCRAPVGFQIESATGARWQSQRTTLDDDRFGTTFPVTGVNGEDIHCYLTWLNRETGRIFKLPNAAQWQWLAYGETEALFPWGEEPGLGRANVAVGGRFLFDTGIIGRPQTFTALLPVGRFAPNQFGVHDVIGNASEYVGDCEMRTPGRSNQAYPSCLVMGAYGPPVFENPRQPQRQVLFDDGSGASVGFRIIE